MQIGLLDDEMSKVNQMELELAPNSDVEIIQLAGNGFPIMSDRGQAVRKMKIRHKILDLKDMKSFRRNRELDMKKRNLFCCPVGTRLKGHWSLFESFSFELIYFRVHDFASRVTGCTLSSSSSSFWPPCSFYAVVTSSPSTDSKR